jgi:hypothetical protein
MRGAAIASLLTGMAGALLGCGKAVLPPETFDSPLFHFEGVLVPVGALSNDEAAHAKLGVLWTDPLQRKPDVTMPGHYLRSSFERETPWPPSRYTVDFFRPPPPEATVEIATPEADRESALLAMGELVLFYDGNDDGTFVVEGPRATIVAPDRYLAGSLTILRYVYRGFAGAASTSARLFPLGLTDKIGYDLISLYCEGRLPERPPNVAFAPVTVVTRVELILQRSSDVFPEVRNCLRTHSP